MEKSKSVATRLPLPLLKRLLCTAKKEQRTKSNMIAVLIREGLDRRQAQAQGE